MTDTTTEKMVDLNSRIDKIEVTLSHAVDAIEKIAVVVNEERKTDWGVIASWASVLMAIGVAVYVPVSDKITSLNHKILQLETSVNQMRSNRWTKEDQIAFARTVREDLVRMEDKNQKDVDRLHIRIDDANQVILDKHTK